MLSPQKIREPQIFLASLWSNDVMHMMHPLSSSCRSEGKTRHVMSRDFLDKESRRFSGRMSSSFLGGCQEVCV